MKLPTELLLLLLSLSSVGPTGAAPVDALPNRHQARDVSFLSLRGLTRLTHDHTAAVAFSHPTKFFHESTFSGHYDGRFADKPLPDDVRIHHLRLLLASYLSTMERIGVRTWLMHGCLLGWWWNGKIMPWDNDVDVMVDERSIVELGAWWNMSVHHFTRDDLKPYVPVELRSADENRGGKEEVGATNGDASHEELHVDILKGGKKYLLEVNPHYLNTSTTDKENVIDARWIDTSNGLFIDITTIHVQPIVVQPYTTEGEEDEEDKEEDLELYTKDQHAYSYSQIFPLRTSTLEGLRVHVPYNYEELLLDEYGPRAITHKWFRGWKFDDSEHKWILSSEQEANQQKLVNEGPDNKGGTSKKQDPNVYLLRGGDRAAVGRANVEVS